MELRIDEHVSLKDKNWFRVGGPARYFCEPLTAKDFKDAFSYARDKNLPFFVLGHGANVLISDDGFDGLIIHPKHGSISITQEDAEHIFVTADAGILMDELIEYTLAHNITGLEVFSAIPGSIGGSAFINLHYFEALISHFLVSAQVIEIATGEILDVDTAWFEFGYNQSKLMERKHCLINATLKLKKSSDVETAFAKGRRLEITRHRISRYPSSYTCGSFFRNFHADEVTLVVNDKKIIWIAYYLDKIGVKGSLSVGKVRVSHQHANMLVSHDDSTAADIVALARTMQELVRKEFGIIPQPECIFVGFNEYPLLQK